MEKEPFVVRDDLLVDDAEVDRFLASAPARRPWPTAPDAVLDRMVQIIAHEYDPLAIILFGSRARGTHGSTSDVDLLVVLPTVEDRVQAALAIGRSLFDAPLAKDVFVATPTQIAAERQLPWGIVRAALQEGILLYERGSADTENLELAPLLPAGSRARPALARHTG